MAFTGNVTATANPSSTAEVAITATPDTAVVTLTNAVPGSQAEGTTTIANTGDVDVDVFISADWVASGDTTASMAAVLADALNVLVALGDPPDFEDPIFTGTLMQLIDQPAAGVAIATTEDEDVSFRVTLSEDAGNLVQDLDITTDFVFVAVAQEEE